MTLTPEQSDELYALIKANTVLNELGNVGADNAIAAELNVVSAVHPITVDVEKSDLLPWIVDNDVITAAEKLAKGNKRQDRALAQAAGLVLDELRTATTDGPNGLAPGLRMSDPNVASLMRDFADAVETESGNGVRIELDALATAAGTVVESEGIAPTVSTDDVSQALLRDRPQGQIPV